jgi:hypothetical protein
MKRLYTAICSLIEAKAKQLSEPAPEPHDAETMTDHERADDTLPHELHAANMHDSIDNDYGARIGFTGRLHDQEEN